MKIRVLVLGDEKMRLPPDLEESIELIGETHDEIYGGGSYRVSLRSRQLAREASLQRYQGIIVCNNRGTGVRKARELPFEVRGHAMIAWNQYRPGDESEYAQMGFRYFGHRYNLKKDGVLDVEDFIRLLLAELDMVDG